MKILLCGDVHWSETSSIVRDKGNKYTVRLENLINTINWVESTAIEKCCKEVYYLGDFFDKSVLSDQELTALTEIKWNDLFHYFIVGNHESTRKDLGWSTSTALSGVNKEVIKEPTAKTCEDSNCTIAMIPYITEDCRKPLTEYLSLIDCDSRRLVLSHNDLSGVQMGAWVSKEGFSLEEIDNNCDLFINGHLHNGCKVSERAINIGNITGQNFGEDASKYPHNVIIFDTDTFEMEYVENPYAFNFYKLEINNKNDIEQLSTLKDNSVLSIKCLDSLMEDLKSEMAHIGKKLVESRIISTMDKKPSSEAETSLDDFKVDYLEKLRELCIVKIGASIILDEELSEVCK